MKLSEFTATLDRLDEWSRQARDAARGCKRLAEKLPMHRFQRDLESVRRTLRRHVFDAEDLAESTCADAKYDDGPCPDESCPGAVVDNVCSHCGDDFIENDDGATIDTPLGSLQLERAKL